MQRYQITKFDLTRTGNKNVNTMTVIINNINLQSISLYTC